MQKIFPCWIFILIVSACHTENNHDSKEVAEEKNEQKFNTKAEEKEAGFVTAAIEEKYAAIKLAELANTKSSNKKVQDVAQKMASNQIHSLEAFQNVAKKKAISFPLEEGEDTRKKVNDLANEEDVAFDKKWCEEIVSKHEKEIRQFEQMQEKSVDPQLTEIITKDLKDLRTELVWLNALKENIK